VEVTAPAEEAVPEAEVHPVRKAIQEVRRKAAREAAEVLNPVRPQGIIHMTAVNPVRPEKAQADGLVREIKQPQNSNTPKAAK
jgi:hypothetical protein